MSFGPILCLVLAAAALVWAWRLRRKLERVQSDHEVALRDLDRRHAEALRLRGQQFEMLVSRMIEALMVLDGEQRLVLANRAAAELFGFQQPATGRPVVELVRHHAVAALLARLRHEPEIRGHELVLQQPEKVVEVNAVRLLDDRGEITGALLVFHDLTKLRRLEGVRQDFVANVSHELRTPLSLIKSAVETLLDGGADDPDVRRRFLEIVERHSARLGLLIEDLLLLSALDSGRVELRMEEIALSEVAREVLDDLAPTARLRGVTLHNDVPPGLVARADGQRLRQIVCNLVDNAIKYGRENGRVDLGAARLDGGWLQVFVRDDGPGIPAELRGRVFERFFRTDKARARTQGGTGLGLAIVKNLVAAHGGEVRVESAEGKGTVFYFKIKAAKEQGGG